MKMLILELRETYRWSEVSGGAVHMGARVEEARFPWACSTLGCIHSCRREWRVRASSGV